MKTEDVLPYKRIEFEGLSLYCLNNVDKYLEIAYGNYMDIPATIDIATYISDYSQWLKARNRKYYIDINKLNYGGSDGKA